MNGKYRFSPIAVAQLDTLWDYGYRRFGIQQADDYLDGLFATLDEIATCGHYLGLPPRHIPPDKLVGITSLPIQYVRYQRDYLHLRKLSDGTLGVVCILGERMNTPRRLKELLSSSLVEFDDPLAAL